MTADRFRAPRVTTYVVSSKIHAIDTVWRASDATVRTVCGGTVRNGIMLRSSPTGDAYVDCKRCAARLADGITVSAATVRRAGLASQLSEPSPGTDSVDADNRRYLAQQKRIGRA
jgi:hypothetical protein